MTRDPQKGKLSSPLGLSEIVISGLGRMWRDPALLNSRLQKLKLESKLSIQRSTVPNPARKRTIGPHRTEEVNSLRMSVE